MNEISSWSEWKYDQNMRIKRNFGPDGSPCAEGQVFKIIQP